MVGKASALGYVKFVQHEKGVELAELVAADGAAHARASALALLARLELGEGVPSVRGSVLLARS